MTVISKANQDCLEALNNLDLKKAVQKRIDAVRQLRKKRILDELNDLSIPDLLEISIAASEIRWAKVIKRGKEKMELL